MRLPPGAQPILTARLKGQRPADMVLLSLVGPLWERNPVVVVPGCDYDWRWAFGLETAVIFSPETKGLAKEVVEILLSLRVNGVGHTYLWRTDGMGWDAYATDAGTVFFRLSPTEAETFADLCC